MMRRLLIWCCRIAVAAIFLLACYSKILQPHEFALAVFRYRMLPYAAINAIALFLPWLELITALGILFVPRARSASALVLLGMLLVFTIAIAFNLYRGVNIACGCLSLEPDSESMGMWNLVRNGALMVMCVVVFFDSLRALRPPAVPEPRP